MRHRALILTALLVCLPGPGHADPAFRVVAWDKLSEDWITLSQHSDREEAGKATVAELNRGEYTMVRMVPDARGGLELSEKVIDDNDFTVNRDFKKYKAYLGRRFAADYKKWRKGMRVLDAGAGQAMLFRTLRDELGDDAPEMVAVGARKPIDEPRGSFAFDRVPIDYTGIAYHEGFLGADGEIEKGAWGGRI